MLTHYFDIVPTSEFMPLPRCMNEIMQLVHVYMLRGNAEGKQRALAFPGWSVDMYKPGGVLRVMGEEEDMLRLRDTLMRKHGDYFTEEAMLMYVKKIPDDVKEYVSFYRRRCMSSSNIKREERRGRRYTEDDIKAIKARRVAMMKKTPCFNLENSKGHLMQLFVGCKKSSVKRDGRFSGYGLSKRGEDGQWPTVPMF